VHKRTEPKLLHLLVVLAILIGVSHVAAQKTPKATASAAVPHAQEAELARTAAEAQGALSRGDAEGAVRGFEKLVQTAPTVAEFHSNLGMAYFSAGRPREAARAFQQALKLKPGLTNAHYFLGASLAESGQCKEALPYLEKDAPRIPDQNLKRVVGMDGVRCAMALSQPEKAVDFVHLLSRDFPDDPDVLYLAVHVYSELSIRASHRLLVTAPGSYQAHQLNAEVMAMQEKWEDAAAEYRKVLSLKPGLPGIHYRLGRLFLTGPRGATTLDDARREFEEELQIDPGNASAEYELGEMARQARQWSVAIEHFSRAVKLEPDFAEAQIGLGKSLVSAGRAQEAVGPLETAVKLQPDNPVAHYQLSFAYRRLGREAEAEKELLAYRQTHDKTLETKQRIRAGILGRMGQEQTAEPPE